MIMKLILLVFVVVACLADVQTLLEATPAAWGSSTGTGVEGSSMAP